MPEAKAIWEHTCIAGGLFLLRIQTKNPVHFYRTGFLTFSSPFYMPLYKLFFNTSKYETTSL